MRKTRFTLTVSLIAMSIISTAIAELPKPDMSGNQRADS